MKKAILTACTVFVASGCTQVDTGFGETTRWNMAQHVINPDPGYKGEPVEGGSGVRSAGAIDRYNRGEVIQPATIATTSTQTGSAGSSAGPGPK